MTKKCFNHLCKKIEHAVGEKEFMSEEYIHCPLSKKPRLFKAHKKIHGGHISGEVKLALTLRCLAGGSYLDLG